MSDNNIVVLGLGSNLGHRENNLSKAIELVESLIGVIIDKSSVHESQAWPLGNQNHYLNQVVAVETQKFPLQILNEILKIELILGRQRNQKWESRIIDIDILFFNNYHFSTPSLVIPHPLIAERNFVLIPLNEIMPEYFHPVLCKKISDLKLSSKDNSWVKAI